MFKFKELFQYFNINLSGSLIIFCNVAFLSEGIISTSLFVFLYIINLNLYDNTIDSYYEGDIIHKNSLTEQLISYMLLSDEELKKYSGYNITASGDKSTVDGGGSRTAPGTDDWVAGNLYKTN